MKKNADLLGKILWAILIFVTIGTVFEWGRLVYKENNGDFQVFIGRSYLTAGEKALQIYSPFFFYEESQEKKNVESQKTTENIIAANKDAISAQILAENQEKTILEENENQEEQEEQEEQQAAKEEQPVMEEKQNTPTIAISASTKVAEVQWERLSDFDFLKNTYFTIDANTTATGDILNSERLLGTDLKIKQDNSMPQILIYHTHSQETFADSVEGDVSTNIVGVGDCLVKILQEQYGYNVIHNTDAYDMANGELDRNKAYNYARDGIEQVLAENPTIEVIIDLHRDGVDESRHLVTEINGEQTAKIMFFNGLSYTVENGAIASLENPYIEDNLAFSFQLELQAEQYYPEFVRTTYLKGYRYNLHFRPKSLLLECGAQTNTVEEAKNAMKPFADILNKVLNGE